MEVTPKRHNRERMRLITQLSLITGDANGSLSVIFKISNDDESVDDNSLALLSLPNGTIVAAESKPQTFHSFVITCHNGERIFGASFIHFQNIHGQTDDCVYVSRALVVLTVRPLVSQLHILLKWCVNQCQCNPRWLRIVSQIRLPPKGKCIKIVLPHLRKYKLNENDGRNSDETIDKCQEMIIYRSISALPFFDYPLRELFVSILSPEQFLLAFACALSETQILIVSENNYNLMLVAESLTALLHPFKWQHVYVPILPSKLGLHYLDAPTPYIMGINSSTVSVSNLSVSCKIDCDSNRVECTFDSIVLPQFIDDLKQELESILSADLRLASGAAVQKSEAMKRVTEIARKHNVISDEFNYLDDMKLNDTIRRLFYKTIKTRILCKHQQFIIPSLNKKESIKFDAVSYLSDQPLTMHNFLKQFLETQMFASFIDDSGKSITRKQKMMQNSLQSLLPYDDPEEDNDQLNDMLLESRFNSAQSIDLISFEDVPTVTNIDTKIKTLPSPAASPRMRRKKDALTLNHKSVKDVSSPNRVPTALTAQTNWRVVETLLREVKVKTKRILLEKMGSDEVGPLGCGSVGGIEENTMIAALCDLIERIWSHARADDEAYGHMISTQKCAFWAHLMAYNQFESNNLSDGNRDAKSSVDSSMLTPALAWVLLRKRIDSLSQMTLSDPASHSTPSSPSRQINSFMKPLPNSLLYDLRSIRDMNDLKTDIGKSRAFVRLALERKLLSKHLRTLLNNHELLVTFYKRYAFLRCEDEREQFLTHLLTLNAVDLTCFTNTFTTTYTLLIYGSGQFSGWFCVSGSLSKTSNIEVNHVSSQFTFNHKNLGTLTTLAICVNQSSKLFVEFCFIRNEMTGHVYKFNCNHWFGRNIEDGATERVLIADLVHNVTSVCDILKQYNPHGRASSIGRNWTRGSDEYINDELTCQELQTLLGENVNTIMKCYFSSDRHRGSSDGLLSRKFSPKIIENSNRTFSTMSKALSSVRNSTDNDRDLLNLIFGERKFIWILHKIFYYGFKNRGRSSFRKQTFLWDYFLRVQCELKIVLKCNANSIYDEEIVNKFVNIIDMIGTNAANYGKDGKFHIFLVISLRDHLLSPHFLSLISQPSLSLHYYDSLSFIRDSTLMVFLKQILNTFNEITLSFDSTLTKEL